MLGPAEAPQALGGGREVVDLDAAGVGVLALDGLVDLLAMNGNLSRSVDSQADLVAANFHDGDGDVIVNDNAFVFFSGEY